MIALGTLIYVTLTRTNNQYEYLSKRVYYIFHSTRFASECENRKAYLPAPSLPPTHHSKMSASVVLRMFMGEGDHLPSDVPCSFAPIY